MVSTEFLPSEIDGMIAHVIEEAGEVLAAAGKLQRWGPHSVNPFTTSSETNVEWLYRELLDLNLVSQRLILRIEETYIANDRRQ